MENTTIPPVRGISDAVIWAKNMEKGKRKRGKT
jgi:hypothetical protein